MLTRRGDDADAGVAQLLLRWSIAFAAACFVAFPLFTQDFWLSAAWGRMIASGINPFHTLFTDNDLAGLPLDHFPMPMSYGPLWGVLSALVALLGWNNAIAMGLLFKVLIAAAWLWSLFLIDAIQRDKPARQRCLAIALFGWVPLGVSQSIAEGHNDIVMITPALLWFLLLLRNNRWAPVALAASVLCKYATAPLFLIDLIHAFRRERLTPLQYVVRMLPAALFGLLFLALFFRSMSFFDGVRRRERVVLPAAERGGLRARATVGISALSDAFHCARRISGGRGLLACSHGARGQHREFDQGHGGA